jgi:histidinol-phosphate phosphatase family protein
MKVKAAFLDRDGIINKKPNPGEYILSWDDFVFSEGIFGLLRSLTYQGYKLVIITNQRCVSMGLISLKSLETIHHKMNNYLEGISIQIYGIYTCPHGENECFCRKPKPGLIFEAQKNLNIDLSSSIIIGDSLNEVLLGETLGIKTYYIGDDIVNLPNSFSTIKKLKEYIEK